MNFKELKKRMDCRGASVFLPADKRGKEGFRPIEYWPVYKVKRIMNEKTRK